MRTLSLAALLVFIIAFISFGAYAQKTEEDAIKKVIDQETRSFFQKNYEKWAETWVKDSGVYIVRSGREGHNEMIGWNKISADYKESMKNLSGYDEASIAPYMNKKDYHFFINGNMASVTFMEGNKNPSFETRTMVKQNGNWKIAAMSLLDNSSYSLNDAFNSLKSFKGKWELEKNSFKNESATDSSELKMAKFDIHETPTGLEQVSEIAYKNNLTSYTQVTEYEHFTADNGTNEINYIDIQKTSNGQTYTNTGKVTSDKPGTYTVKSMNPSKPEVLQFEYTVTLQPDGKWHQVNKYYGPDGKVTGSFSFNMHRL